MSDADSMVSSIDATLPRWVATGKRYGRNLVARRFPVTFAILLPSWWKKSLAPSLKDLTVSTAIGSKLYITGNLECFTFFLPLSTLVTTPGSVTATLMWLGARMSEHVKSHARHWSWLYRDKYRSSGCLHLWRRFQTTVSCWILILR